MSIVQLEDRLTEAKKATAVAWSILVCAEETSSDEDLPLSLWILWDLLRANAGKLERMLKQEIQERDKDHAGN